MRLLTQNMNIHHFVGHSYPNREARVNGLLAHVDEFDVVMLQELFKFHVPGGAVGEWRDRVVARWPHHHQASHAPPHWFQQDTGLLILSKHPIVSSKTIFFKERSVAEMVSLKGALMTKLRLSDEGPHLVVITAHLDAHSLDIRLAQLKQIMTELVHKELAEDEEARIVLGGDLNIDSIHHAEAWEATKGILHPLESAMDKGAYRGPEGGRPYPVTHHKWDVCLDHIFVHGVAVDADSLQLHKWPAVFATPPPPTADDTEPVLVSDHYGASLTFVP